MAPSTPVPTVAPKNSGAAPPASFVGAGLPLPPCRCRASAIAGVRHSLGRRRYARSLAAVAPRLPPRSSHSCAGAHPPHRQRVRVARPLARVAPARPPPPARPRRPSPVPPPSKTTTTTAALTATTTLTTTTTTTTTKQQQQHQLQQQQQQQQQTQQHSERAYERESVASAEIVYFRGGREAGKAKQVQVHRRTAEQQNGVEKKARAPAKKFREEERKGGRGGGREGGWEEEKSGG